MSPFNCFSSTSHDDTLPRHYNSSALPQLAASTRGSTPSPARTPSKRPSLRMKRPSDDKRPLRPLNKRMISNPSGFQHVGGAGLASKSALPSPPPLPPVPSLFSEMSENKLPSNSTPPPRPPRERPYSLPASPKPLGDASNRSPVPTHAERLARRQSLAPPPKRKPAPPVTASIIKQAGGTQFVSQSGAVPSLMKQKKGGNVLEIEEIFSKSELRMIEKYEEVGSGSVVVGGKVGETETMKWKGAMKEIEQALKQ